MKGVQLWRCGKCGHEYDSPIRISEVLCMTREKGKRCRGTMKVVKGIPTHEDELKEKEKANAKKGTARK